MDNAICWNFDNLGGNIEVVSPGHPKAMEVEAV
jgi:hypothetical protein